MNWWFIFLIRLQSVQGQWELLTINHQATSHPQREWNKILNTSIHQPVTVHFNARLLLKIWLKIKRGSRSGLRVRITLMRIRILIKVIRICDHWSMDPPGLHFELPSLYCERTRPSTAIFWASKASEFLLEADPDPTFHSNADTDPGLHFELPSLYCERTRPSTALFWAS